MVSRYAGKLVAVEDSYGHMAAPMYLGKLEGCALVCPLHEAAFDITTGQIIRAARLPAPAAGQEPNPWQHLFSYVRTYSLKVFPLRGARRRGLRRTTPIACGVGKMGNLFIQIFTLALQDLRRFAGLTPGGRIGESFITGGFFIVHGYST